MSPIFEDWKKEYDVLDCTWDFYEVTRDGTTDFRIAYLLRGADLPYKSIMVYNSGKIPAALVLPQPWEYI